MKKVDVVISAYGKPYHTAVSLLTLLKYSRAHIDKIYFGKEPVQPHGDSIDRVVDLFRNENIIVYKPHVHLGNEARFHRSEMTNKRFRQSIRYQYAWEHTDKDYLFVIHNDVLFEDDVIGQMLEKISAEKVVGVGMVGQCWNCPAHTAKLCDGTTYSSFNPSYEEAVRIVQQYPSPRTRVEDIDRATPMPLPECRLNEFACLIKLAEIRDLVYPRGSVPPLGGGLIRPSGSSPLDVGQDWFRALVLMGYRFVHHSDGFRHGWAAAGKGGQPMDFDRNSYARHEEIAREYLERVFGVQL